MFLAKSAEFIENKRVTIWVRAKKRKRVRKNVKTKGLRNVDAGEGPLPPGFFVSADYKEVTGTFFVSADSARVSVIFGRKGRAASKGNLAGEGAWI